jgi:PKD domain/NHL repeat
VEKLDSAGRFVTKWGSFGRDDGQFAYLQAVAVDAAGDVFVLDSGNNRVQKFAFAPNGAPAVSSGGRDAAGVEGGALSSSGSFSDPDSDALTLTADNAEGAFVDNGDGSWSWALTPTDDRAATSVTVTASDGNGHTVTDTFVYSALNAKPVLAKLALSTGGAAHCKLTVRTSFTDAGSADTHSGSVDWGDVSPPSAFTTSPVSETHSYAVAGRYPLTVVVADDDAGSARRATAWNVYDKATGPLAPINSDGSSAFALGSTVAVIVKVVTCAGAPVTDLTPTVSLTRLKNTKATTVNETVSNTSGDTGMTMHYDAGAQQYVFELATAASQFNGGSDLSSGNYRVKVSDPRFDQLTASAERAVSKTFNLVP